MYAGRGGFNWDDISGDKIHPALYNIGPKINIGLFNWGTNVPYIVFPGGTEGSPKYHQGRRAAIKRNNEESDNNNRSFHVKDTDHPPNVDIHGRPLTHKAG